MNEKAAACVRMVARLTREGERVDGQKYEMSNDDAFDTVNRLITEARAVERTLPRAETLTRTERVLCTLWDALSDMLEDPGRTQNRVVVQTGLRAIGRAFALNAKLGNRLTRLHFSGERTPTLRPAAGDHR